MDQRRQGEVPAGIHDLQRAQQSRRVRVPFLQLHDLVVLPAVQHPAATDSSSRAAGEVVSPGRARSIPVKNEIALATVVAVVASLAVIAQVRDLRPTEL